MPFKKTVDRENRENTGGVTGSFRTIVDGHPHQYKFSIHDAKLLRKLKAQGTDRENFGEVIASFIAQSILGAQYAPEVLTCYDKDKKQIDIISRYLDDTTGTIDQYKVDVKKGPFNVRRKHKRIHVLNERENRAKAIHTQEEWQMHHHSDTFKSLARAIAISAIIGDHDVNPSNMVVMKKQGQLPEIGRIDFGHAFNDLLNAPRKVGGVLRDPDNPMFDFFNRTNVAGIQVRGTRIGGMSKVWRDYVGLVPSDELGDALLEMYNNKNLLLDGVEKAKEEFLTLLQGLDNDEASKQQIIASFSAIHEAITGNPLPEMETHEAAIEAFFESIGTFIETNAENAKLAGQAMKLQHQLDLAITDLNEDIHDIVKLWEGIYKDAGLMDDHGQMLCPWFKTSSNRKAIQGSLAKYVLFERYNYIYFEYPKTKVTAVLKNLLNAIKSLISYVKDYFQKSAQIHPDDRNNPNTAEELNSLMGEMQTTRREIERRIPETDEPRPGPERDQT